MRFEAFVARRYLRSKRKNRFVSLITLISVAGVSVGVMALIVVMSVMTGFDRELMATIVGNRAHLQVRARYDEPITHPNALIAELEQLCPEMVAASPFTLTGAVLKTEGSEAYQFAYVMGVDIERETKVTQLADNLTRKNGRTRGRGELPGKNEIVLGYALADSIGAYLGDRVIAITMGTRPKPGPGWARYAQQKHLVVSGISQAQMSEWDSAFAFVDLETAAQMKGIEQGSVDGVHMKLTDPWLARDVGNRIEERFGYAYNTMTWYESQQAFFEALVQEKVAMFIILSFIVLVAAFNITSTLIMIVMEKRRDIGILRTIGMSSGRVMLLFMLEGLYIGVGGTLLGVIAGVTLAYNLNPVAEFVARLLGIDLFNSVVYFFDRIPVAIVPRDIAMITLSAVGLTFLSTLYPAWSAARLDPVDALRYE